MMRLNKLSLFFIILMFITSTEASKIVQPNGHLLVGNFSGTSEDDVTQKEGDDYPARLYISFAYNPDALGFFEKAKYGTVRFFLRRVPSGQYPQLYHGF